MRITSNLQHSAAMCLFLTMSFGVHAVFYICVYTYIILLYDSMIHITHIHYHNHRPSGGGMVYYIHTTIIRVRRRAPFTLTLDFVVIILDLY